jgi:hypothetical protein
VAVKAIRSYADELPSYGQSLSPRIVNDLTARVSTALHNLLGNNYWQKKVEKLEEEIDRLKQDIEMLSSDEESARHIRVLEHAMALLLYRLSEDGKAVIHEDRLKNPTMEVLYEQTDRGIELQANEHTTYQDD